MPVETPAKSVGTLNLYERLAAVRKDLDGSIDKNGQAPAAMGGFRFIAWDDIADKVGELLTKHGIAFLPSVTSSSITAAGETQNGKSIWRAVVYMDFKLVNVAAPDDSWKMSWVGVGDDTGDKASQKAITSATKYALLKLFLLKGADDSDASDVTSAERNSMLASVASEFQPRRIQTPPQRLNPAKQGEWSEGDPCPTCAELGLSSRLKIAMGGRNMGRLQCTGKLHDGSWANHLAPAPSAEKRAISEEPGYSDEDAMAYSSDPDSIPF